MVLDPDEDVRAEDVPIDHVRQLVPGVPVVDGKREQPQRWACGWKWLHCHSLSHPSHKL
jgi:hypothetical protein